MRRPKTLLLGKKDVKKLADLKKSMKAVEKAFKAYALGNAKMPSKIYLDLAEYQGDFRAMPAYLGDIKSSCLKWVNVHPRNKKFGLPTVMAILILSDPRNGFPLCIMDGTYPTSLRTAAAGGVAAKYLAKKDSKTIGLVGCGEQARTQLETLRLLFPISEVRVWGHKDQLIKKYIREMKIKNEKMTKSANIKDCVKGSDIVVTTTPSRKPLVKLSWLIPGVHITAIGADAKGKIELEPAILKKAKIVIDDWAQASHSGEINVALATQKITKKNIYSTIGEIVAGKRKGRSNKQEITVFDSTGLAIQDVAVGHMIYKQALKNKTGKFIEFV